MRWTAIPAAVVLLGAAALPLFAQESKPPVEGDALVHLIGLHRRSPVVQPLLQWDGPGLELRWREDRLAGVLIRVAPGKGQRAFPGALPAELPRTATKAQVNATAGWSRRSEGTYARRFSTQWHERPIDGFEIRVHFEGDTYAAIEVVNDAARVHAARSRIIQELVPASDFQAGHWAAALGADVAAEPAALIASWVGWRRGGEFVERAGLGLRVRDETWIEELRFRPDFAGPRPFDLPATVTVKDLEPRLGPPDATDETAGARWRIVAPGSAPYELALLEAEAGTTIALRCDAARVRAWQRQMQEDAPLPEAVAKDLAQVWALLRADFEILKGVQQQQQGLLGTVTWWRSAKPLGGILGGTVHVSPEDDLFRSRRVRYLLRRCGEAEGRTPRSLIATLEPAVEALLGEGWTLERTAAGKGRPESSVWTDPEADPFGGSPTARLTAEPVPGGFEVWIELGFPLSD